MSYTRTVYRTQVQMAPVEVNGVRTEGAFRLWSIPYPVHHGLVTADGRLWAFHLTSVPNISTKHRYHLQGLAQQAGSQIISLKAGQDMAAKFNRVQRMAMGQQQCPRLMGSTVCGEPAQMGTVWCMWHPYGLPTGHV